MSVGLVGSSVNVNVHDRTVQESRQLIDEKIALYERSILELKYQRNELASVSRLPPEVLGTIFVFASAAARYGQPSSWFNFSYVCQLWRNVALTTPNIWCFIPLHQQWATTMLERSKTADLILDLNLADTSFTLPRVQFIKNSLDNHTSRIRELSVAGVSSSTLSILLHDLQPSSLRLRSLRLIGIYEDCLDFPASILANSEGLWDMDLVRCNIAWCSMPLTGLTSLKMSYNSTRPLWLDFITALGDMASLATLEMRDSLPLADKLHRRTSNPIKLTKLRELNLGSTRDIREVLNVFSSIVVPQVATIKAGGGVDGTSKNVPSFLSDFSSSFSAFISEMSSEHSEAVFYQTLVVESTYNDLDLEAWKDDVKPEARYITPANLDLSIHRLPYPEKMLHECTKHFPLSRLKTLYLSIDISQVVLRECFGNLPQLRNVTVSGKATLAFIRALIHKSRGHNRRPKVYYGVTFPALESLKITEAIFSPDHEGGFTFEELQDCLMERCNRNAEVRKLTLYDCFCLYERDVDLIREIVVDVDWDEQEDEYISEDEDEDDDEDMYSDYYSDYNYGDSEDDFTTFMGY